MFCPNCFDTSYRSPECYLCGYQEEERYKKALRLGMQLNNRYIIGRVLGNGGFGITYLAYDKKLRSRCAIKEYYPLEMAVREERTQTVQYSGTGTAANFKHGLEVFIREAQTLSRLGGITQIVSVTDFFMQYGTGYIVMEFIEGFTLKDMVLERRELTLEMADRIVLDLASTLKVVHDQGLIHRDVSPDNVFITRNGGIKLIDFGAARSFLDSRSRDVSMLVKPGFTAPEQYSSKGIQGTWTDVYSLAATYYYMISKRKVPEVMDRINGEEIVPLHCFEKGLGEPVSGFMEKCLAMDYKNRIQNMPEFIRCFVKVRAKKEREIRLTAILGENQVSTWKLLPDQEVVIGRSSEECQVVIADAKLSRRHCSITYDSGREKFVLRDYSANGTSVLRQIIGKGNRMYLDSGDMFCALSDKYRFLIEIR